MNECNICFEYINVSKCASCSFHCCTSCMTRWKKGIESLCPVCKKFNTYHNKKHMFFSIDHVEECKKYDELFEFIQNFYEKYGKDGSIKIYPR